VSEKMALLYLRKVIEKKTAATIEDYDGDYDGNATCYIIG
jgi:hypothetical protein